MSHLILVWMFALSIQTLFGMLSNFWLKARYVISGKRKIMKLVICVRFHVNLPRCLAFSNIYCNYSRPMRQNFLMSLLSSFFLTLDFSENFSSETGCTLRQLVHWSPIDEERLCEIQAGSTILWLSLSLLWVCDYGL